MNEQVLSRWVKQRDGTQDRGNSRYKNKDAERSLSSGWFQPSALYLEGCAAGRGWDQIGRGFGCSDKESGLSPARSGMLLLAFKQRSNVVSFCLRKLLMSGSVVF